MPTPDSAVPAFGATIGWVDEPWGDAIVGPNVRLTGWALAIATIRTVEIRIDGHVHRARYGLPRDDVAAVRPGYPDNPRSGFEFHADFSRYPPAPGVERRTIDVVAIAADGSEKRLGRRSLIEASARARWQFLRNRRSEPFHLIPALSGIAAGGAHDLERWYDAYVSPTTRIGMRVPILYLRTTTGRDGDYRFDPDFDVARRLGTRAVADDSLNRVLAHSRARRLPLLVTLNGGIWSDAGGTCPAFDVNDRLEEDVANCQWNERNEVMADDHLTHLPGSQSAPELARALTLNVYARAVREYKRRNLAEAARPIVAFMRADPGLFIGVNLDPDVYINPFFEEKQWYDYNPDTLAQFRHWLAGSGPYAGDCERGVPDLSAYRRATPLSLMDVCALSGRTFARWDDADPPRTFSRDPTRPYWRDPWVREWEHFRRHLVALHYSELAAWLVDAGVPASRIWSAQGFMAPTGDMLPLALSITSPVKDSDSGGVSIEGSKPRDGHLGAIVYGAAATNDIPMENGRSLYATLAAIDPRFGIVEFNTADLRHPDRQPSYEAAYRGLRDVWNAGARFVSPMAWNGSDGLNAERADYVTYTAWRNTLLEQAALDFLLARAGLPLGSKLWTFGTSSHADDDGWRAQSGSLRPRIGAIELTADAGGRVVIVSPTEVQASRDTVECVVIGVADDGAISGVSIATRPAGQPEWQLYADARANECERTAAGILVSRTAPVGAEEIDQLRVAFTLAPGARIALARIALLRG